MASDEPKKGRELAIDAASEVVGAVVPLPGAAFVTRTLLTGLVERVDRRRVRLLNEFIERWAEEERFGDPEKASRMLEEDLPLHEEQILLFVRSVFDVVSSDAVAPLARLYSLDRQGAVQPRVRRRTIRVLIEADSGAIDAIAGLTAALLRAWPITGGLKAALVHIRGFTVTVSPPLPGVGDELGFRLDLNHHEDADEAFDLLTDHFFRYEGPAPGTSGYRSLGGHRGPDGLSFTCTREEIAFLDRVVGPQRPPAGPGVRDR